MASRKSAVNEGLDVEWRKRFNQKKLPPIVRVTWMDACSWIGPLQPSEGWEKKYPNGSVQQTVGYQLKGDERFLTISQDISTGSLLTRHMVDIPTALVLEVKELK